MKSIKVEYTLSDGRKIIMIEKTNRETDTEQDIFDSVLGYNSGMTWDIDDFDQEVTVDDIRWIRLVK